MGLDVYAYKYENRAQSKKLEEKYERESTKIWAKYPGEYNQLTEEQKDEARKLTAALKKKLGLDEYGCIPGGKVEINSKKYPKHMFKIGYLRSSYNDGGFNSVMKTVIGSDLYDIFQPGDDSEFRPYWIGAKATAEAMLKDFEVKEKQGTYNVIEADQSVLGGGVKNKEEALALFEKERDEYMARKEKGDKPFESYSKRDGTFYMKNPVKVVAVIPGISQFGKHPSQYLVFKDDLTWYKQALEITIEMIDYVLASPDKEKFYLHWSG